jgi:hypothetical protein
MTRYQVIWHTAKGLIPDPTDWETMTLAVCYALKIRAIHGSDFGFDVQPRKV